MSAPIRVEQLVDVDTFAILVTLDPERMRIDNGKVTLTLTPDESDAAGGLLYEAGIEPDRCAHDERFATVIVDGDPLCQNHARALDLSREATR